MRNSIRFFAWPAAQTTLVLLPLALFLALDAWMLYPPKDYLVAGGFATGFFVLIMLFFVIGIGSSLTMVYLPLALAMSSTRKSNFAGLQVVKLANAAISLLVTIAAFYFYRALFGEIFPLSSAAVILVFFGILLLHTMGETVGIICVRYGKIGMTIYILTFAILGGFVGFFIVSGDGVLSVLSKFLHMLLTNSTLLIAVCLVLCAAFSAFNWLFIRKMTVRN